MCIFSLPLLVSSPMEDAELPRKSPLALIFFTIFLDLLGVGILIPVIPQLLANPNSPHYLLPVGMSLGQGYVMLGLLTASYPLAQFFAAPILGQLSDRYGRRPVLALSVAGTSLSYLLFAFAILTRNIPLLFVSRTLDGITGGNLSVAQAAIADVTTPENRSKNFGLVGAAFGLGFIAGPYIGGKLADPTVLPWFNAAVPFWFAAILAAVNVTIILLWFQETNLHRSHARLTWNKSVKDIVRAVRLKKLRTLFLTGFLYQAGFSFFTAFFGVYLIQRFSFTEGNIGDFFAYVGIWIVVTQALITRQVAKKFSERAVLNLTLTGTGLAILLFLLPRQWWWMLFIVPVFSVLNGLSQANYMGLLSRSASRETQGEVLGINASLAALAQSIPPILSGFAAASLEPSAPVLISAVVIGVGGVLFSYRTRKSVREAA